MFFKPSYLLKKNKRLKKKNILDKGLEYVDFYKLLKCTTNKSRQILTNSSISFKLYIKEFMYDKLFI